MEPRRPIHIPHRSRATLYAFVVLTSALLLAGSLFAASTISLERQRTAQVLLSEAAATRAAATARVARVQTAKAVRIATDVRSEVDHAHLVDYVEASLRWYECLSHAEFARESHAAYVSERRACFTAYGREVHQLKLDQMRR